MKNWEVKMDNSFDALKAIAAELHKLNHILHDLSVKGFPVRMIKDE